MVAAERTRSRQAEFEYRNALRQQDVAIDLQMQERAKLWEIEKMEIRSRGDFAREEQRRQQVLDQYEAGTKHIKDNVGNLYDDATAEKLLFQVKMKALGQNIPGMAQILFPRQRENVLSLLGEPTAVPGAAADPLQLGVEPPELTTLPPEQMELIAQNKFRVISPDGDEETIDASEWPARKAAGYLLADIVELREQKARREVAQRQFRGFSF